jgi:4-hydroxy-tetrahydrodipicolinate reductase
MMRFAEMAAPTSTAEIIELHHDGKVGHAGTAISTAERIAAASSDWLPDPTTKESLPGARGARGAGGIPIHAIRLRGLVSHQEVLLGKDGQSLSIRHDSYNHTSSFMPGVLLAVRGVRERPGLTFGLDALLGL